MEDPETPGYYWIRTYTSREWEPADFYKGNWSVIGKEYQLTTSELGILEYRKCEAPSECKRFLMACGVKS